MIGVVFVMITPLLINLNNIPTILTILNIITISIIPFLVS